MIGHYLDLLFAEEQVSDGTDPNPQSDASEPPAPPVGAAGEVSFAGPMATRTHRAQSRLVIRVLMASRGFLEIAPPIEFSARSVVGLGIGQKAATSLYDHLPVVLAQDEEWFLTLDP